MSETQLMRTFCRLQITMGQATPSSLLGVELAQTQLHTLKVPKYSTSVARYLHKRLARPRLFTVLGKYPHARMTKSLSMPLSLYVKLGCYLDCVLITCFRAPDFVMSADVVDAGFSKILQPYLPLFTSVDLAKLTRQLGQISRCFDYATSNHAFSGPLEASDFAADSFLFDPHRRRSMPLEHVLVFTDPVYKLVKTAYLANNMLFAIRSLADFGSNFHGPKPSVRHYQRLAQKTDPYSFTHHRQLITDQIRFSLSHIHL